MERPTGKFLKDMSNDELRAESDWHVAEADRLLGEVRELRARALDAGSGQESMAILISASEIEAEADAHKHQSLILLAACRPTDEATPIVKASAASKGKNSFTPR
jgi:hypothetical protein